MRIDKNIKNYIGDNGCYRWTAAQGFPYQITYIDSNGNVNCPDCATCVPEEIEGAFIYWEGETLECDGCGREIESEYGVPEQE